MTNSQPSFTTKQNWEEGLISLTIGDLVEIIYSATLIKALFPYLWLALNIKFRSQASFVYTPVLLKTQTNCPCICIWKSLVGDSRALSFQLHLKQEHIVGFGRSKYQMTENNTLGRKQENISLSVLKWEENWKNYCWHINGILSMIIFLWLNCIVSLL